MWKVAKLLLMILLPLAWGIGSDFVFAKFSRSFSKTKKQPPGIEDVSE